MKFLKVELYSYKGNRTPIWAKAVAALILAGILLFAGSFLLVSLGGHSQIQGDVDYMVVLGNQVKPWGPSQLLQDRLNAALSYWKEDPEVLIVVSGGQGADEPMSEAQAMFEYLVERGVSEEQILLEDQSRNTWENLRFSKRLLEEQGYDTAGEILVVSNEFHLTRVRMLFQRVWGSDEGLSTLAAPSSHIPSRIKMYLREPLALVKSVLFDR